MAKIELSWGSIGREGSLFCEKSRVFWVGKQLNVKSNLLAGEEDSHQRTDEEASGACS